MFHLHPQLERDTFFITEMKLCRVLLMNNNLFPWIILVPRVENAKEIIDLPATTRHLLMDEISATSLALQKLFSPDKLNIATLGNQVSQLHVHIIARFTSDKAWPNPVWGKESAPYQDANPVVEKIKQKL